MEFKVIVPVSEIGVDIEAFGAQVIRKTVFDIHAEMLEAMRGPKSGRTYKRRGGTQVSPAVTTDGIDWESTAASSVGARRSARD